MIDILNKKEAIIQLILHDIRVLYNLTTFVSMLIFSLLLT